MQQESNDPPPDSFEGVIFDCDGTLADTMPLHFRAWQQCLAGEPVDFKEQLFYDLGGVPSPEIVRAINERCGSRLDPESTAALKETLYLELLPLAQPIEKVVRLVHAYRGRYRMAVASGGVRVVIRRTVEALGLTDAFDLIATADDVKRGKPAPDLFLYAAKSMGVAPSRCIVYEDSALGLEAARRAGMRGIDIRSLPELVALP